MKSYQRHLKRVHKEFYSTYYLNKEGQEGDDIDIMEFNGHLNVQNIVSAAAPIENEFGLNTNLDGALHSYVI